MSNNDHEAHPGILALFECKCPRCRLGYMFKSKKAYSKGLMKMNDQCDICGQHFELEVGFYYGSGYISYAITVALSIATFIAWWLTIGISYDDNRVFLWLILNAILILALQPPLMRLSRVFWLALFVKYDRDWRIHPAQAPERTNEAQRHNW